MVASMNQPVDLKLPNQLKQLALNGNCRYNLDGNHVHLTIEEIANNRIAGTLSDDLSVELWALPSPYQDGQFSGHPLAGTQIGQLNGQQGFRNWEYSQALQMPPEGLWHVTLMLREWQNGEFVTRDYVNFPDPVRASYKLTLSLA